MREHRPSLLERVTLVGWGLLVASGLTAAIGAPLLLAWLSPEALGNDRRTRGTVTIVWLALATLFVVLGGLLLWASGIALLRCEGQGALPAPQDQGGSPEPGGEGPRDGATPP